MASPSLSVDSADPIHQFFADRELPVPLIPELSDPNVPIGAPLFLEALSGKGITIGSSLLPQQYSPSTGTKSPVMLSPNREHAMEVIIATKYGKQHREPGMGDEADSLSDADGANGSHGKTNAHIRTHRDMEFDRLMDNVDRIKAQHQQEVYLTG